MNLSKFFIDRPIFAGVLSVLIFLAGLLALRVLPISEYPEVVPPSVVVRAQYPGANPKVIAETVATPLEEAINGVEGMLYMSSQATTDGLMTLTVTFKLGTDPDKAQQLVQNRVAQAEPRLPEEVRRLGVTTVKSSPDLTMVVHLRVAERPLRHDLPAQLRACSTSRTGWRASRASARCSCSARGDYSMRVWLDPQKVAERGLSASDVVRAIRAQNVQAAAGVVGASPGLPGVDLQLSINAQGRLQSEEEFGDIIVKTGADGEVTRLRDIARIELGAAEYALRSLLDNKPAVGDRRSSRRRARTRSQISDNVRATMAELKKNMPEGVDYEIVYDPTQFVRASIEAVVHTLLEAIALVVLVVILFLQTWRASIIPLLAVPVSIVGTFAVMYLFGFSINALSCSAWCWRSASWSTTPSSWSRTSSATSRRACRRARRPTGDARGVGPDHRDRAGAGRGVRAARLHQRPDRPVLQQFALTIAISTVISAINSLTLSPALAALLLKGHDAPKDALTRVMDRVVRLALPRLQPRVRPRLGRLQRRRRAA